MKNQLTGNNQTQDEWFTHHLLTDEQVNLIILAKLDRAKIYSPAVRKKIEQTNNNNRYLKD